MIKLIQLISELQINNPNVTAEEIYDYFIQNIEDYYILDDEEKTDKFWNEYKKICEPYCKKYRIHICLSTLLELKMLSQLELNKLYHEMKQLVQKYAN